MIETMRPTKSAASVVTACALMAVSLSLGAQGWSRLCPAGFECAATAHPATRVAPGDWAFFDRIFLPGDLNDAPGRLRRTLHYIVASDSMVPTGPFVDVAGVPALPQNRFIHAIGNGRFVATDTYAARVYSGDQVLQSTHYWAGDPSDPGANNALPFGPIVDVNGRLVAGMQWASSASVMISDDRATTWVRIELPFTVGDGERMSTSAGGDIWIVPRPYTGNNGLWVSRDRGSTWARLDDSSLTSGGRVAERVVGDPQDSQRAYAISSRHLMRSTNGGVHWVELGAFDDAVSVAAGSDQDGKAIIVGTSRGIFVSRDDGQTWNAASNGLLAHAYRVMLGDGVAFAGLVPDVDAGTGFTDWYVCRRLVNCLGPASTPKLARLEIIAGDRQVAVNSTTPPAPYRVRAIDAARAPLAGYTLFIGPTSYTGQPTLVDEFGFRGFNTWGYETWLGPGPVPPEYLFVTDQNGVASGQGQYRAGPPSAFIVAAADVSGPTAWHTLPRAFFSVVMTESTPAGAPSVVIEYFHAPTGHYFNTLLQDEIDLLEAGRFSGWSRSIGSFIAYASAQDAPAGTVPVCRFFSEIYTAHFYTADQVECQIVLDRWPDVWTLETRDAFYVYEPDKATGQCAAGLMPVYRLYSTRNGPNHRYVSDRALRDTMVNAGWMAEGYGSDSVMLCTPK